MQHEATAQPEPLYLSRADAAAYVAKKFGFPCSEQTLAKLAVRRQGPQFKRANGRFAVYSVPGLDAWAVTRISNAPAAATDETEHRPGTP